MVLSFAIVEGQVIVKKKLLSSYLKVGKKGYKAQQICFVFSIME